MKDLIPGLLLEFDGIPGYDSDYFNDGDMVVVRATEDMPVVYSKKIRGDYFLTKGNLVQFKLAEGPW